MMMMSGRWDEDDGDGRAPFLIELEEKDTQNSQVYHSLDLLLEVEEDEEKPLKLSLFLSFTWKFLRVKVVYLFYFYEMELVDHLYKK